MGAMLDAAINGIGKYEGYAYFFNGPSYVRYDWASETVDEDYPMPLSAWDLPADYLDGIDAALNGRGPYAGKAYFFRGDQYVRYDWASEQVEADYPLPISAWPGLPQDFQADGVTSTLNGYGDFAGKAYFFHGREYARYDWDANAVDLTSSNLAPWRLPTPCSWNLDAALEGQGPYEGKSYFFRHGVYVRYDWLDQRCDEPPTALAAWSLPHEFLHPSGEVARNHLWFVTIDTSDYIQEGNLGYDVVLGGVERVAGDAGVLVDPIWMPNLRDEFLADDTLLALWGCGSYDEWFDAEANAAWASQLDSYCAQLRETSVPMLAVCGSHQLVARAFADWSAVGHMAPADVRAPTIADEYEQHRSLIPRPRLGEVGVFPMRAVAGREDDPLLAGLPATQRFQEWHHDQVFADPLPRFQPLLEPDPDRAPETTLLDSATHENPATAADRCQVQGLRLDSDDRVLYSTQFHPEAPSDDPEVSANGDRLIENFLGLARDYWA